MAQCQAWVSGLSHTLGESTVLAMNRANRYVHELLEGKVRYMGWLLKKNNINNQQSSLDTGSINNSIKVKMWHGLIIDVCPLSLCGVCVCVCHDGMGWDGKVDD